MTPTHRRTLSGKRIPNTTAQPKPWEALLGDFLGRLRGSSRPTASPEHPSRKHDVPRPVLLVTPPSEIAGPVLGQPRRRDRRAAARAAAKVQNARTDIAA